MSMSVPEVLTSEPVGKSVPRIDAYEKVTGSAIFADDMQFGPGLYYGRLVRSPHAHAMVRGVDASKALAMPGYRGARAQQHRSVSN
jgi:CO/xanthine dehydrogenase Mo-binding subunit